MIFLVFRSQVTNEIPMVVGQYMAQHGTSSTALALGPVLGFGLNPRTICRTKNRIASGHNQIVATKISNNLEVNSNFRDGFLQYVRI